MEEDHEKTFAKMRKQLNASEKAATVFDPDGEAVDYLRALADIRVFFEKKIDTGSMRGDFEGCHHGRERLASSFTWACAMRCPESLGRDRLDNVIKEEMGHIRLLSKELAAQKK